MMRRVATIFCVIIMMVMVSLPVWSQETTPPEDLFLSLFQFQEEKALENVLDQIEEQWEDSYSTMVIESITLQRNPTVSSRLLEILYDKTDAPSSYDLNELYEWLWEKEENITPGYHRFKAEMYRLIDNRFEDYFLDHQGQRRIRMDEIRWGGVLQDGIPPLRNPTMITANEAGYLQDDHIVFGIEVNGDARAYPKRILAWHEMFVDEVGGIPVAGVYCTLCGTVILFETELDGTNYELGTSGFLYRSNKLMYDKATQSMWNTIWGEPVLGPLVGKGIKLNHLSVVTTTWGAWKERHPDSQVLSLNTGHVRDYREGKAYEQYFSTDQLMFNTPFKDRRLKNKEEVLALRFNEAPDEQLAISASYLKKHPVYEADLGGVSFVVLTDDSGANRVYERGTRSFSSFNGSTAVDKNGASWTLTESALVSDSGEKLTRLPYHRSFWFGWLAAYPNTKLVK